MQPTTLFKSHRKLSHLLISILIFTTPYTLFHTLCTLTHTTTPIIIVTSESMEPQFQRGDMLFVSNRTTTTTITSDIDIDVDVGEVVVVWLSGREKPFVHRVIAKRVLREAEKVEEEAMRGDDDERYGVYEYLSNQRLTISTDNSSPSVSPSNNRKKKYGYLTKGDNSPLDDTVLYPPGQPLLYRSDIVGVVKGHVPHIGRPVLIFEEYAWLKRVLLAISALVFVYELT